MPYTFRRGYLNAARESSYGVVSTTSFPGAATGPLGAMFRSATLWGGGAGTANVPIVGLATTSRDMEPTYNKLVTNAMMGRRYDDVMQVPGRRQINGSIQVPVTPNSFGFWLYMTFGADAVVATQPLSLAAASLANATTITTAALTANVKQGQRIFFRDTTTVGGVGTNPEYAEVAANASSGATSVTIQNGAGTGGGLKFPHAINTLIEFGPWTHTFTPSNSAASTQTFQLEDNFGGVPSSPFYTGLVVDSMELSAPIEGDANPLEATFKVVGTAVNPTGTQTNTVNTFASPNTGGTFGWSADEVPMAAGNLATFAASNTANVDGTNLNPVTSGGSATKIYVPDFKATVNNTARFAKATQGSPDPYAIVATNWNMRGSMDTVFEDYGVFFDYARGQVWTNAALTLTWGYQNLVGTTGPVGSSLTINVWNFAVEKANKPQNKNDLVWFPIEAWRALDNGPNVAKNFTNMASFVLVNNIAQY